MSLPPVWIERIFYRLTMTYGHDFMRRWEGIDEAAVRADWARELASFERAPHGIAYALENLPIRPPTVIEFRAIAQRAPTKAVPQLPAPRANPDVVRAAIAKARAALTRGLADHAVDCAGGADAAT